MSSALKWLSRDDSLSKMSLLAFPQIPTHQSRPIDRRYFTGVTGLLFPARLMVTPLMFFFRCSLLWNAVAGWLCVDPASR
jgi:hypothetical protein